MFAKSRPNMTAPSDQKSKEKLAGCVYEYLNFIGAKKAAESFIKEVPMDTQSFQLNEPPGFLASWWYVFWDLYNAAPERRMQSEHTMEARAFQDYINPGMPYHMQQLNPGMPPNPGSNMVGQQLGPDVGVPNFYMQNQMRPPMQQSQGPMGPQMQQQMALQQQPPQQGQVFLSGPRYPTRPPMRMEMAPGVPTPQQNMNPAMHRVSPGAARMPGPAPPNANVPYQLRPGPGMPPQNAGNLPIGMPQNQHRPPWPPMSGNTGPGPSAYSTPPPGSIPPGYPPLTPSNSVPPQHPNVNATGMLSSPVQEMPPNGTDMYGNSNNQSMGLSLQRMPSTGQMQPSYMPGQNMDLMGNQMNNVQTSSIPGGGISQAPTPLQGSRGGPQTPQGNMPVMSAGGGSGGNGNDQMSGLMNGEMDAINKASQNRNSDHNSVMGNSSSQQSANNAQQQHQQDVGGGGHFVGIFPETEDEAILKYKQSLQDDVRRFEQTSTRNQLTPGSSAPNSVQASQQGASTNGGSAPGGLERPLSSGGMGVNGSSLLVGPGDASQQQQPGSAGPGGINVMSASGPHVTDYLFQSNDFK